MTRLAILLGMVVAACGKTPGGASTTGPESGSGSGSGSTTKMPSATVKDTTAGAEPDALVMTVQGSIAGTTPEQMDALFVNPMLDALGILPNTTSSITRTTGGHSDLVLRFKAGTDVAAAQADLQKRMDDPALHDKMPAVDRAGWVWGDPAYPSAVMAVTGGDTVSDNASVVRLLLSRLDDVPNLDRVMVRGPRQAVVVRVDLAKAASYGLTIASITTTMQNAARPNSLDDVAGLVLMEKAGTGVTLKDVATLEVGFDPYAPVGEAPGIAIWVHPGAPRDPVIAAVREIAAQAVRPGMALGPRIDPERLPLLLAVAKAGAKTASDAERGAAMITTMMKTKKLIVATAPVAIDATAPFEYEPDLAKMTALKIDPVAFRRVRRTFSGEQVVALTDGTPVIFAPPDRIDAITVETEGGAPVLVAAFATVVQRPTQVVRVGGEVGALVQLEPTKGTTFAELTDVVAHEASVQSLPA